MGVERRGTIRGGILVAGLLAACAESGSSPVEGSAGGGGGRGVLGPGASQFLELVPDAPFVNAYYGTRHVELHHGGNTVEYREEVGSDGNGLFAIEPIEVLFPHPDPDVFLQVLRERQVFTYRFRDWRIHDYDKFLENYIAYVVDPDTSVAGIDCVRFDVVRDAPQPRNRYTVDIDPQTGLVLRWEERDIIGALLGRMEFETFQYGSGASGMTLVDRVFGNTTVHSIDDDLQTVFGFQPLIPTLPPASGMVVLPEIERMVVDEAINDVRAKVTVTDGVEVAVLVCERPVLATASPSRVEVREFGTWTGLEGEVKGYPVIGAGKFDVDDLSLMLQSAF